MATVTAAAAGGAASAPLATPTGASDLAAAAWALAEAAETLAFEALGEVGEPYWEAKASGDAAVMAAACAWAATAEALAVEALAEATTALVEATHALTLNTERAASEAAASARAARRRLRKAAVAVGIARRRAYDGVMSSVPQDDIARHDVTLALTRAVRAGNVAAATAARDEAVTLAAAGHTLVETAAAAAARRREGIAFGKEDRRSARQEQRARAAAKAAEARARAVVLLAAEQELSRAKAGLGEAEATARRAELLYSAYQRLPYTGGLHRDRHVAVAALLQAERRLETARLGAALQTNAGWAATGASRQLAATRALSSGWLPREVRAGASATRRGENWRAAEPVAKRARRLADEARVALQRERDCMGAEEKADRAREKAARREARRLRRARAKGSIREASAAFLAGVAARAAAATASEFTTLVWASARERAGHGWMGPAELRFRVAMRVVRVAARAAGDKHGVFSSRAAEWVAGWRELRVAAQRERSARAMRLMVVGRVHRCKGPAEAQLSKAWRGAKTAAAKAEARRWPSMRSAVPSLWAPGYLVAQARVTECRDAVRGTHTVWNPREEAYSEVFLDADEVAAARAEEAAWAEQGGGDDEV